MCRRARPTIDVAYLLWTSTTPAFRQKDGNGEALLRHYYSTLVSRLDALGYKGEELYTKEEFKKDYKDCSLFGYQISQMHTMVTNYYSLETETEKFLSGFCLIFFQLHLTPPDASEGKLDFAQAPKEREAAMKFFAEFVRGQISLSR